MEITYKINLDRYNPNDIIELHQLGIITLKEIIASDRINSCFSDELYNYVKSQRKLEIDRMDETVINTVSYNVMQSTRKAQ